MVGSKRQVVLIHGGSAYSRHEDFLNELKTRPLRDLPGEPARTKWTATFKEDLGEEYEIYMPSMPNSQNARYQEWKIWFERYLEYFHDGVCLIGWSLGGAFLVKYLSENEFPVAIKEVHLLAAPYSFTDFGNEDGADFRFDSKQVTQMTQKVGTVTIWHSEDDFIVPYEHALKYKTALPKAELITFSDKNHFLIETFPELLKAVRS